MKYAFKDFLFDSKELTLHKDDKKLNLKQKPAKILALFLAAPETIYSKEDILHSAWPERKVTDQVVFQNIGHLRALFGDDAIKTFSRKGYQWQIPCSLVSEQAQDATVEGQSTTAEAQNTTAETQPPVKAENSPVKGERRLPLLGLAGAALALAAAVYFSVS